MLKICIFDKEQRLADKIENIIDKVCQERGIRKEVDVFSTEEDLNKEILIEGKYDIALFCIKEEKEVDVAIRMRKNDEDVIIIFLSESDKILRDIVCLNAFAFIQMPTNEEKLKEIFLEAYYRLRNVNQFFFFRYNKEDFKVIIRDILYFENKGRQVKIYVKDGEIKVFNGKLKEVEKKLEEGKMPFLRIHQSFLVNYYFISSRLKSEVTLTNGIRLPISESKQKNCDEWKNRLNKKI